ncbi:putative disease resistance protein [Trifolium repens]|nr:putative disease resistance protein [Trifolium repens]
MEGFLTDLGKTFAEKLINSVIKKSRYLFCFKCIANEFESEKDNLEVEWKTMKQRFTKAIEKDKDIAFNAQWWEEQAAILIQEDTKTNQRCFFGFCPNCIWRYKRGKQLAYKIDEIKKLVEKGEKFETIEIDRRLPDIELYSSQYYISFKSREFKYKELLDALKDDNYYAIGLHGMGGTGIPNIDNHKGCKILVTTRTLEVCNKMACGITIQLELLSEEDAWAMFKRYADLSDISSNGLLKQGRKIADECKGLPVAIATIASSLRGQKHQVEWDVALQYLQNPMSMGDVDDTLVVIYKCLKYSYDNLTDKKAKELFLLCSVFKEDEEISTEILTRLGIGVGLFGEGYVKYNYARKQVVVAKNKLLDSCLLLKTNESHVKMHDLVREVAQRIANKEILVVDSSNKKQMSSNIKYLLFEGNSMDLCSSEFDGSKLQILILIMVTGCFVDSFFENIAGLRVLNLIAGENVTLSSLPQSIQSLTNIRSLLIEKGFLGDISVLGSLQSLETLDLKWCTIEELPQQIAQLKKLRLLNLSYCIIKHNNPFEVIQRCPSLEELYFWRSFNGFCQDISLPTLERYHLNDGFGLMNNSISNYVYLQKDYLSEATFKHVIQTTKILKLERIKKGWRNLMPEIVPIDQGMNDLIELRLKYDSQLERLIDTKHIGSQVPNVFSNLVVLELKKMESLKELCNGPISSDSLNNLEELSIKDCEDLGSLFKYSLKLCNLKTVILGDCPKLVSVFDLSTSQSLLLLERLIITDCKQLENIFTNERKSNLPVDNDNNKRCNSLFPKLDYIHIAGCYNLKHIFGQQQDVELASLKKLWLDDLPNFIGIFPESYHSSKGSSHSIYKPQTKLEEEPIKSNKFPWSHFCCYGYKLRGSSSSTSTNIPTPSVYEDQPQHCSISLEWYCLLRLSHVMCNIKEIVLMNVSKIKSVFTLSVSLKMLSLETLTIVDCDELERIVIDIGDGSGIGFNIVFPNLKELYVNGCKKLEYIFGHINANDHHHENHLRLPALKCLKLYCLPSLISMGTKNYHIMLSNLVELELIECPQVDNKSIGEFVYSMSKSQVNTTIEDSSGNDLEAYLALENLRARDSKFQYIFYLGEINEQQRNLGLQEIKLYDQHQLPKLWFLLIGEAAKLDKIFGGSEEKVGRFPNLNFVVFLELPSFFQGIQFQTVGHRLVHNCKNLSLTSTSTDVLSTLLDTCYDKLDPDLAYCMHRLKQELKEHSKTKEDTNVTEIQSSTSGDENDIDSYKYEIDSGLEIPSVANSQNTEKGSTSETRNEPPTQLVDDLKQKDTKLSSEDFDLGNSKQTTKTNNQAEPSKEESEAASKHELPSSQELMNPQQSVAEINTIVKPSQDNNLEGSTSEKTAAGTLPAISGKRNEPNIQIDIAPKQKFAKDDEIIVSKSQPSPIASQFPSMLSKDSDLYLYMESLYQQFQEKSKGHHNGNENSSAQTTKEFAAWIEAEAASRQELTSSQIKMKQEAEANRGFVENVPDLEIPPVAMLPTNSNELMNEKSMDEQCLMNPQQSSAEIDTTIKPSEDNNLEGSTSEKTAEGTLSTITGTKNDPPIQLDTALNQKDIEISVQEGTTSTIAMEDINNLMEEDPLLALVALENLLTGQVSISSIRVLLQELKTLMDSSSDLDHLVSNKESKSKLISLFHQLNQHQGMLTSDEKDFVEKVQNFFNDNLIKHATSQQLLKKYNQVLDSKTDLMNKLRSAKSTQTDIDRETSTTNAQIHELSLQTDELRKKLADLENQIDGLKSVGNQRNVQKMKLKAQCSELAQQSKELLSALASLEVDIREAERAKNLAKEGFANLKSLFPAF